MIKKYLLLGLLSTALPAWANTYFVSINTASISGVAGSLFFSFGPGALPFDPANAIVSGFSGGTLGAVLSPAGSGTLPGTLTLDNNGPPENYQQSFTYGSKISFFLSLTGAAVGNPSPGAIGGTDLAFYLLDGSDNPLLTDDPNGTVFDASIAPKTGQVSFATFTNNGGPSVVSVTAVPEPGSMLLLLSGVMMIGVGIRRS